MHRISDDDTSFEVTREYLVECSKLYLTGDLDNQRLAVTCALHQIARHFESRGFAVRSLAAYYPSGAGARRTPEQRNRSDVCAVGCGAGRPRATTDMHLRTAILAVFADVWLKMRKNDGRTQSAKLAEAARKMRGPWFGQTSGAKLKTAREVVSQESKDHLAVEFAERFRLFFDNAIAILGAESAFPLMARYINGHEVGQGDRNLENH